MSVQKIPQTAISPADAKSTKGPQNTQESAAGSKVRAAAAQGYAKAASTPTTSNAANVTISPKAREMSLARKIVDATPDVREDKVAQFKELIDQGKYKPNSEKIADGIIREAVKDEIAANPEFILEE